MGSITIVKGVSGSGKSSRVFQLLKFFQHKGFSFDNFKFTNINGKEKSVGVLIPDLDLIFIGKIYKKRNIEIWQGFDVITSAFVKVENFSNFLKENSKNYSFIIEGAGITDSHRFRPQFLHDYCGFENIFIQYYSFELNQKDEYLNRIIGRSGKPPLKDAGWLKVNNFRRDFEKSLEEHKMVKSVVLKDSWHAPIDDFGLKYLLLFDNGGDDAITSFMGFTEKFDYISKNKFENY